MRPPLRPGRYRTSTTKPIAVDRMRMLPLLISAVLGGILGGAATLRAVLPQSAMVATMLGPWRFSPHVGAADADPYVRARLFLSGELPVASGQGYTLRAYRDSDGATLDRRCRYRIRSPFPPARYFTLTLTDSDGRLVSNLAERVSFTSSEIVRREGGSFEFAIAADPQPGNWLPTGEKKGNFVLDLRLYDTPLSATATQLNAAALPAVTKTDCAE